MQKLRVVHALVRVSTFVRASDKCIIKEKSNVTKRVKVGQMLSELGEIRRIENDIQLMESAVGNGTSPSTVENNSAGSSLIDRFDTVYYDLAASAGIQSFSLTSTAYIIWMSSLAPGNCSSGFNSSSIFQFPKRKSPTFSRNTVEWQGFEDLFKFILSRAPELPYVERFGILKNVVNR